MADIKFDVNKFKSQIRGIVKDAPFERIGRVAVKGIKDSVRRGISPVTGKPIPELSPNTIARRDKLDKINRTSKFYRPDESNLTFTGQLLNSLNSEVISKSGQTKVRIFPEDRGRFPVIGLRGKPLSDIPNSEIAKNLEEGDPTKRQPPRPFLGIDQKTSEQVKSILRAHIDQALIKLNR